MLWFKKKGDGLSSMVNALLFARTVQLKIVASAASPKLNQDSSSANPALPRLFTPSPPQSNVGAGHPVIMTEPRQVGLHVRITISRYDSMGVLRERKKKTPSPGWYWSPHVLHNIFGFHRVTRVETRLGDPSWVDKLVAICPR